MGHPRRRSGRRYGFAPASLSCAAAVLSSARYLGHERCCFSARCCLLRRPRRAPSCCSKSALAGRRLQPAWISRPRLVRRVAPSAIDDYLDSVGVDSFGLGILVGAMGTVFTFGGMMFILVRNLNGSSNFDGNKLSSSGGFVMPAFFFQGAQDIFSKVRKEAVMSTLRFKETGRFAEIYKGIERSQEESLQRSIEALRELIPRSATREVVFGALRQAASSSSRIASALYDFALRIQPATASSSSSGAGASILEELWTLDEARCEVSGRRAGEGGRRPWVNADADILVDEQVPAQRRTLAECAKRPLFARVAPELLARPTYLALVRVYDVFQPQESQEKEACVIDHSSHACGGYTASEQAAIDEFLEQVTRTAVMRCAFRHITNFLPSVLKSSWKDVLFKLWFQRRNGKPCVFEHIFLGNLSEDLSGQPIAGGFHNWLKFYLEEVRNTATYLGYIYNNAEDGINNSRFVSGKFVWDHAGFKLVKDQGGFFIGTSPEWQLASGTVAYFETCTPEFAERHGWVPWPGAYSVGYTKDATHSGERYRHVLCREAQETGGERSEEELLADNGFYLASSYAIYLGPASHAEEDTSDLDRICSSADLVKSLPRRLESEGLVTHRHCRLCEECVRFCVARGCRSIRDALALVRRTFQFDLEDAVAAAKAPGYPRIRALVQDTLEVVPRLLARAESGSLREQLPDLLTELREEQGRRGARLHQPIRLLLTGRADGVPLADILQLLELIEQDGGDEAGLHLPDRLATVRELFSTPPFVEVAKTESTITFVS
eukprot:TRINITY_DN40845_c0_g1_i1.p1 TRINITY_DN40845_c0_g1~~TRINITY_DN40845_c0_g1_i1.p1  ORF type:complete len:780 (+),score=145.96 TRINITY_DN40845_c0_g1_i1:53-2392(+)